MLLKVDKIMISDWAFLSAIIVISAPGGPIPHNLAKTFDGPANLRAERFRAPSRAVTSFLLRFLSPTRGTEEVVKTIEKAWLEVELPLERETEGFEKIPSLMGKSDASECNESSLSNCRVQKPFWQSCDVIRMNTTNKGERPKTGCFPLFV